MEFNRNTESFCPCCVTVKPKTSFLPSLNETNRVLPYCKDCLKLKFKNALKVTKNKDVAMWSLTMELGIPLIAEIYEMTKKQVEDNEGKAGRNPDLFLAYYNTLKVTSTKFNGNYDSDLCLSDYKPKNGDITPEPSRLDLAIERDNWNRIWGKDYTNDQCKRLDEYYESYTETLYEMDTAMVLRYRDLCKAELRKFETGDKEATDEILKLMKILKIDDFKKDTKDDTDRFIDKLIWTIEETEPAEEEDRDAFKDIMGFEKSFNGFMRSMRNLLTGSREYPDIPKEAR